MKVLIFSPGNHPAPRAIGEALAKSEELVAFFGGLRVTDRQVSIIRVVSPNVAKRFEGRVDTSRLAALGRGRSAWAFDWLGSVASFLGAHRSHDWALRQRNRLLFKALRKWVRGYRQPDPLILIAPTGTGVPICQYSAEKGIVSVLYTTVPDPEYSNEELKRDAARRPQWARYLGEERFPDNEKAEVSAASVLLANSTFTASTYTRSHKPTLTIPLAMPKAPPQRQTRAGKTPEPLRLLFAGRIVQLKGLGYLFEALSTADFDYKLTLVGPDPYDFGQALRAEFPGVDANFVGPVGHGDMSDIYASHDVFVFPSLLDSFGNALAEAAASGLAVVSTRRGGAVDLGIFPKGGLEIRPGSAPDIASAIRELDANRSAVSEMSKWNAERAAQGRNWGIYGEEVATALRNL